MHIKCHGLGLTIEQLFEVHPSDEAERSLLNMYESDLVGVVSRSIPVRDLHTLGKLPGLDAWTSATTTSTVTHAEFIGGVGQRNKTIEL
jgi:hypothetical protein